MLSLTAKDCKTLRVTFKDNMALHLFPGVIMSMKTESYIYKYKYNQQTETFPAVITNF